MFALLNFTRHLRTTDGGYVDAHLDAMNSRFDCSIPITTRSGAVTGLHRISSLVSPGNEPARGTHLQEKDGTARQARNLVDRSSATVPEICIPFYLIGIQLYYLICIPYYIQLVFPSI